MKEALELDRRNVNSLWEDALKKEMHNVRQALEIHEGDDKKLVGYQKIRCHIVWDVKLGEGFRQKARLVAGGHTTEVPACTTYSSVVSRDSVRIALTIAALNDLKILACGIQNSYLVANCKERIYTVAGPEFGSEMGITMIVRKALYGLKSSGAAFRSLLAGTIWELGYRPTEADPDVWLKPAVKSNGYEYYEMLLVYVDDVISISENPEEDIRGIQATFELKGGRGEVPEMYLGADIKEVSCGEGKKCWTMSSDKYVKTAVSNVEENLAESNLRLPPKCITPTKTDYHPSEDVSHELDSIGTS